ncbi:hypothetical protein PC129_g14875 [Phytophthora cactorum]|uniref:Uncharacterized protein n=1 Tax=Phytophthora cactorum TaxID=29920 RepID=A0A8T1HQ25_9STRA|nr:hypothetical protein PC115_g19403 [Phytophthora cactorum]KAG3002120.1 hypothetical protein PC120_g19898 [Phytophthora cactorum]KAG3161101.1 hypothetical protein PC128_g20878 [Phytophthora cactorum]KAG3214209.1 hypothetical protein PC129_g14875 [Phytophthora cactorum]
MSTEDDSVADLTGDWEVDAEEIEVAGVGGEAAQSVASAGAGSVRAGDAAATYQVATSYDSQRKVGVFSLFFTSTPKDRLRKWTSDVLALDDHIAVTDSDI